MKNHIVVIGTSAGGLQPLKNLLQFLPEKFQAPIIIAKHISEDARNYLPGILSRCCPLKVKLAQDNEPLKSGRVYIAPPTLHLTVEKGLARLNHGPKVNHCRPAIDPLFFSAALEYGSCAIGIILSGLLDDGSAGLLAIKRNKGVTLVQSLDEAEHKDMPRNAIEYVSPDYILETTKMAKELIKLVNRNYQSRGCSVHNSLLELEVKMNKTKCDCSEQDMNKIGVPSVFACPDCHGVLWEIKDKKILRFRCRVGHAYSKDCFIDSLDQSVEDTLWAALRALEEQENLTKRILTKVKKDSDEAKAYIKKAATIQQQISVLRPLLTKTK